MTISLKAARLVPIKTLDGFDFSFQPLLDKGRILDLAQLHFIERAEVVHLRGPPGTGKGHLATALGVETVRTGKRVYRATRPEIIKALSRAERGGRLRLINRPCSASPATCPRARPAPRRTAGKSGRRDDF